MPGDSAQPEKLANEQTAGTADVVIGVLSHNSGGLPDDAPRCALEAFTTAYPDRRAIVIHAHGGSREPTPESESPPVLDEKGCLQVSYAVPPAQRISPDYYGVPGKANGVRAILDLAIRMNASACAIVDSSTSTPTGEWIPSLIRQVLDSGVDLVLPDYIRHKYEGTILNGILYPLGRALYGKRLHPPIAGSYALSAKLMSHLASQPWPPATATSSGADAWITVQTLCGNFRVAEVSLGQSTLRPRDPPPEVSTILTQILGSVFAEMTRSSACWQHIRGSQPVPSAGPRLPPLPDPAPVDPAPMWQSFRLGYKNLQDIYSLVLPPGTMMELNRMSRGVPDSLHFDDALWARVVYDFALAWRMRILDRTHLLAALTPLYLGWVAAWIHAVRDASPAEVRNRIETLCMAYEAQKSYLIARWRWPDRFNP